MGSIKELVVARDQNRGAVVVVKKIITANWFPDYMMLHVARSLGADQLVIMQSHVDDRIIIGVDYYHRSSAGVNGLAVNYQFVLRFHFFSP